MQTPYSGAVALSDRPAMIHELWRGRTEFHARQNPDPKFQWTGKRQGEITPSMLGAHVHGQQTFGQYQIDANSNVHWLCADADVPHYSEEEARVGVQFLEGCGLSPVIEESSPGRIHVWVLLTSPLPANVAYAFGQHYKAHIYNHLAPRIKDMGDDEALSTAAACDLKQFSQGVKIAFTQGSAARDALLAAFLKREFFPKQAERGDGFGNLVRLPWGLHQVKRVWSQVLTPAHLIYQNSPLKVLLATSRLERETPDPLARLRIAQPLVNISDRKAVRGSAPRDLISRIEACDRAVTIQQLVGIALGIPEPRPGEKIMCPFHYSSGNPSFMVGGSTAKDVTWCWSDNCRLAHKKLTRFNFVRELLGTDNATEVINQLESFAGLR